MNNNLMETILFKKYCLNRSIKLAGDASKRIYYRAYNEDEKTYIMCFDNDFKEKKVSTFLDLNKIFIDGNVLVPKILDIDVNNGLILQEDLGDQTLLMELKGQSNRDFEFEIFKKVIDELIKINKISHKTTLMFDAKKLLEEVDITIDNLFVKYKKINHEEIDIRTDFEKICQILDVKEKIYCHRDFHSKNIMVSDNAIRIIDYQDARLGIPQYDLVSLLDDCYYEIENKNKENLKRYYWEEFCVPQNLQTDYQSFLYYYDMMTVQRAFKAIGSFCLIYNRENNSDYLQYVDFTFNKIINVLQKYNDFKSLELKLCRLYGGN